MKHPPLSINPNQIRDIAMTNQESTSFRKRTLLVVVVTLLGGLNNTDKGNDGLKRAPDQFSLDKIEEPCGMLQGSSTAFAVRLNRVVCRFPDSMGHIA